MFNGLKDKAAGAANAAKAAASGAVETVKDAENVAAAAKEKAQAVKADVKERANSAADKMKQEAIEMVIKMVDKGVDKVSGKVAAAAGSDPDMPKPIKKAVDMAVHALMDEVKEDIKATIRGKAAGKNKETQAAIFEDSRGMCAPNPISSFRAWVLYTMFPHDLTTWGKMRVKSWWFIMLMANFPVYGVSQAYFLLLFLLMDKGDVFQLVNFVISLKVASVVAIGFIPAIMGGAVVYIDCVKKGTCATEGPGMANSTEFLLSTCFFGVQIVLTWLAALCLCCAKTKGSRQNVAKETTDRVNKGLRRFAWFIVYDILIVAAIAAFIVMHLNTTYFVSMVFWGKCFYGYLCLPWFVLKLPLMKNLIMSTKITAYNPRGKTVPKASSSERKKNRERRKNGKKVLPV